MERVTKSGKQTFIKTLFGAILIIGLLFRIEASYAQTQDTSGIDNNVKLLSSSHYTDGIDYLHVIGEVQNTLDEPQEFVKVIATFYDSTNRTIGTSFTFTDVDVLRPEEKSPFNLVLDDKAQRGKAHNYKIHISSNNAELMPANLKLTVGDNYYDDIGYVHVLGEVTNQATENTKYVKVSGTVYNDKNQAVATDFTFTEPTDLLPGQSAPFDIIISEHASTAIYGKMYSGSLNVQSSDYAMILPAVTFLIDGSSNIDDNKITSIYQFDSTRPNDDDDNDDNGDGSGNGESCDPSYPDVCIPSKPPDLDCPQITERNFRVVGSDPHRFDGNDNDGIGCEESVGSIGNRDEGPASEDDEESDELPSCQDENRQGDSCRDDLDTDECIPISKCPELDREEDEDEEDEKSEDKEPETEPETNDSPNSEEEVN